MIRKARRIVFQNTSITNLPEFPMEMPNGTARTARIPIPAMTRAGQVLKILSRMSRRGLLKAYSAESTVRMSSGRTFASAGTY